MIENANDAGRTLTLCLRLLAAALLCIGLSPGCGAAPDPSPGGKAHILPNGFRNTDPAFVPPSIWERLMFIPSRTWTTTFYPRTSGLPVVDHAATDRLHGDTGTTVTWIGHSTLLVRLDGMTILTDPQWSERASPVSFAGPKRFTPPGVPFEQLPPVDVVLISHDHYDHLDVDTVQRLATVHNPLFLAPLGLKAWFADLGITKVEELDWWESREIRGLTLTCLPAQHFSGRTLWDHNRRLWSTWAVAGAGKRFFFAGDTGYYPGFKEIGSRFGPFDLAAIPIGAYVPPSMMRMIHITPEEALQLFADIQGRNFAAVHWGTFDMTDEPVEEPPLRLNAEARRLGIDPARVWVFKHGETREW